MTVRKLCTSPIHDGSRWLLCIDFNVKEWLPDKSAPRRLQSHCKTCQRVRSRLARRGRRFPHQERRRQAYEQGLLKNRLSASQQQERRRKMNRRSYRDRRDPRLPIEPFREWLNYQIMTNSLSGVARNVGVTERRVQALAVGHYISARNGKKYVIKHVRYSTVEKWMNSFGDTPAMIYDTYVIERYRAVYHDSRRKKRG